MYLTVQIKNYIFPIFLYDPYIKSPKVMKSQTLLVYGNTSARDQAVQTCFSQNL